MREKRRSVKLDIKPDDIKANIYSNIRFIVDMQGTSTSDLEFSDKAISKLLDDSLFNRVEDTYTYDELNEWDKRANRHITNKMKQRLIESEKVIRYISNDEKQMIIIGKLYVEIKLIYGKGFNLKEQMDLLQKIVKEYTSVNPFIQIDNIILLKNNAILCKTLYMLYRCFDSKKFGDIKSGLTYGDAVCTEYNSSSRIAFPEYNLIINKEIVAGTYQKNLAYMGKLNFIICYQNEKNSDKINIRDILQDMNSCLFDIFIQNLTYSFLMDLVMGKTDKVLGGFKLNE